MEMCHVNDKDVLFGGHSLLSKEHYPIYYKEICYPDITRSSDTKE